MARPYRREKVASGVQHVVGETIAQDLHDPRVEPLATTVTRVEVTADLQLAKVYISVLGGDAAERRTLAALKRAAGWFRRRVALELPMRHTPELRFLIDEGARKARQTMELLAAERQRYGNLAPEDEEDAEDEEGPAAEEDAAAELDDQAAEEDVTSGAHDPGAEQDAGGTAPVAEPPPEEDRKPPPG